MDNGKSGRRGSMPVSTIASVRRYSTQLAKLKLAKNNANKQCDKKKPGLCCVSKKNLVKNIVQLKRSMEAFQKQISFAPKRKEINLIVLGSRQVGKTALVVRYMTRRFIREYMSGQDQRYHHDATNVRHQPKVVFLDTSSEEDDSASQCVVDQAKLNWADGVVIVYDVGDMTTFQHARNILSHVMSGCSKPAKKDNTGRNKGDTLPILLLGNKADLWHRRRVSNYEAQIAALQLRHLVDYCELSAADDCEGVVQQFDNFVQRVQSAKLTRSHSF